MDCIIFLFNYAAFKSLRVRIGGSLQDQVVYQTGKHGGQCHNFSKTDDGLFGFSSGCLPMKRWDKVNHLFNQSGVVVTFGLNALVGRQKTSDGLWSGPWDSSNARDFVKYTVSKGYNVDSWGFGNELSGSGVAARVDAKQYAEDLNTLRAVLKDLYQNSSKIPLVLAPGGFFDKQWYSQLLENSGPQVLDVLTHHIYNLGAGVDPDLKSKILNPFYLSEIAQTFKDLQLTIQEFGPWSSAWVGESGGAYNSGGRLVSNTFINSFWYLDQLGMSSTFNTKVYCRQALIGGNYALLNTTTFVPNPDYYSALLWHRLMGNKVLQTTIDGTAYLRAYTHCGKSTKGITLLLINMSNTTTFQIRVREDTNLDPIEVSAENEQREEYKLKPKDGNLVSQTIILNGKQLELTEKGDIPPLQPTTVDGKNPITIDPLSIAFITFKDFQAPACA
ncbi:unnamed protein product [Victoria cruziana]